MRRAALAGLVGGVAVAAAVPEHGAAIALGTAILVAALFVTERGLGERRLVVLFRNFDNELVSTIVTQILSPVASASGRWVTLADERVSYRNTGIDVAPAIVAAIIAFAAIIAATDAMLDPGLTLLLAFVMAIGAFVGVFYGLRSRRHLIVAEPKALDAVRSRMLRIARGRAIDPSLPALATVQVADAVWHDAVRGFLAVSDAVVFVRDEIVSSDNLAWEWEIARTAQGSPRLIQLHSDGEGIVRVEVVPGNGPAVLVGAHHVTSFTALRGAVIDALTLGSS